MVSGPVAFFTNLDIVALRLAINSGISKLCPGGIWPGVKRSNKVIYHIGNLIFKSYVIYLFKCLWEVNIPNFLIFYAKIRTGSNPEMQFNLGLCLKRDFILSGLSTF